MKPAGGLPEALADAHAATVSDVAATAAATFASAAQGVSLRLRTYAREFMHVCVCVCVCVRERERERERESERENL